MLCKFFIALVQYSYTSVARIVVKKPAAFKQPFVIQQMPQLTNWQNDMEQKKNPTKLQT